MNNYEQYLNSYSGKELLKKFTLDTEGRWEIRGEDPNCDFGGFHHSPSLGFFEGTLEDVIKYAITLPGFYTWGGGGEIIPAKQIKFVKIDKDSIRKIDELKQRKSELEKELSLINEQLKAR